MIEFRHIFEFFYQGQAAVNDLNLTIDAGELFVLNGPSGSGKTTALKLINRLVEPTDGDTNVVWHTAIDYKLEDLRGGIALLLQNSALFPNMTIFQNAGIQLEISGVTLADRQTQNELLDRVGLDHTKNYAQRMPNELSGGEQQRVGIVRALAAEPDIILMDEPFSALDPLSRRSLQDLVLELHADLGTTILFVTHDMGEALRLGNRIGVMYDGVLQQVGSPQEITTHPANELVETLFSERRIALIQDVLDAGFGQAITTPATMTLVPTDSVATLSEALLTHDTVTVADVSLTTADLLRFVARG